MYAKNYILTKYKVRVNTNNKIITMQCNVNLLGLTINI